MTKNHIGGELSLDRYRAAMEGLPLVTVDILFFNPEKTKTLLGKRASEPCKGMFYSFGGRLYKNEEFSDAAVRIASRETNISLSPSEITFAGVVNEVHQNSRFEGVNYHAVDVYFACIIEEDRAAALDAQHSEAKWVAVTDQTLHPNVRERIRNSLRAL